MANNPLGSFEDVFEQGVSQISTQVKKQVSDTAKTTVAQVTGAKVSDTAGPASVQDGTTLNTAPATDQFNETNTQSSTQDPTLTPTQVSALETSSAQEQQVKLAETREKLKAHKNLHTTTYFDPTFNKRQKEQPVAEKLEQEKAQEEQKKMQDIQEQKKKDEPIALARAKRTTEMNRGASG